MLIKCYVILDKDGFLRWICRDLSRCCSLGFTKQLGDDRPVKRVERTCIMSMPTNFDLSLPNTLGCGFTEPIEGTI